MKIYLKDQSKGFRDHLEFFKKQTVMKYVRIELVEKNSSIAIDSIKKIAQLNSDPLFQYRIFPQHIMTYLTQWSVEKREMEVGDTIVQQAFLPPFSGFSQKVIFGVRINEVIRETSRIGFSYETLDGHVEKGVSTFTIEENPDESLIFKIHTFSKPGSFITRLLGPFFSVPYQTYCTGQALRNLKQQIEISSK